MQISMSLKSANGRIVNRVKTSMEIEFKKNQFVTETRGGTTGNLNNGKLYCF